MENKRKINGKLTPHGAKPLICSFRCRQIEVKSCCSFSMFLSNENARFAHYLLMELGRDTSNNKCTSRLQRCALCGMPTRFKPAARGGNRAVGRLLECHALTITEQLHEVSWQDFSDGRVDRVARPGDRISPDLVVHNGGIVSW